MAYMEPTMLHYTQLAEDNSDELF